MRRIIIREDPILEKSKSFALRIIKLYKFLMTGVTYVTPVRANTNSILLFLINSK